MLAAASLSLARAVFEVVLRLGGAGAVEQGFAALLGFEAGQRERLVERERGLARLVGGDPHIAGRGAHARGRRVLVGRGLRRFLEACAAASAVAALLRLQRAADERVGVTRFGHGTARMRGGRRRQRQGRRR